MWTNKDLIELVVILAAILGSWYNLKTKVAILETKVTPVYNWFINGKQESKKHSAGA